MIIIIRKNNNMIIIIRKNRNLIKQIRKKTNYKRSNDKDVVKKNSTGYISFQNRVSYIVYRKRLQIYIAW